MKVHILKPENLFLKVKNKKLVYILLPLAVIIWGIIIFRIIKYVNQDAELVLPDQPLFSLLNDTTIVDSFTIVANYSDPFKRSIYTPSTSIESTKKVSNRSNRVNRNIQNKRIRWPNITYGGIIESNEHNEIIAIVNIDNKNCLMRIEEESQEVMVLEIYNDSIKVRYQEELKTITKIK
jgi:hypothetical protein